jgi:hypothetical protein
VVVALDITDPGAPIILWDYETAGQGLTLASGPVRIGGTSTPVAMAVTNLGSGTSGINVVAIDAATGDQVWAISKPYDAPQDAANLSVPATGIPGGATGVDFTRSSAMTHVLVPTLYGELWMLEADTGASVYGAEPLFRFSEDYHPIGAPATLYRDATNGRLHALVGSGGYADPSDTSWSPATESQYVVSVSLDTPIAVAPVSEDLTDSSFDLHRPFVIDLGPGKRVFSQITVAGNEIFVVTDTEDVNLETYGLGAASGELSRFSLDDGAAKGTAAELQSGAGGVDVTSSGEAVSTSGGTITSEASVGFNDAGQTTEIRFTVNSGRQVWLRLR